ncbi:MAG: class I SAM-dependent methyltransferase [Planctomycetota bacterium]|jgi:SAM-dependent methyltransferase
MKYLFGDTDLAARRLAVLAETFEATSAQFLRAAAPGRCELAVDLGSGPGYTTHLVAETVVCERAVGLDTSEHFVDLAERTATDKVRFLLHDATRLPWPVGPCDLIYARYLLAHLPDAEALVAGWTTQLRAAGRLLLEEVDSIETRHPVFREYLSISEAMLSDGGSDLYVGRRLAAMDAPGGASKPFSRVAPLTVTNRLAAQMFVMNFRTWRHNAFVKANYPPAAIGDLERRLGALAAAPTNRTDIEWRLRQVAFEA